MYKENSAPIKKKNFRFSLNPSMIKSLRKAIMTKSMLRVNTKSREFFVCDCYVRQKDSKYFSNLSVKNAPTIKCFREL